MFFVVGYPVYHSMYDDFVWMSKFGDPMFRRHVAGMFKVLTLFYILFNLMIIIIMQLIIYKTKN